MVEIARIIRLGGYLISIDRSWVDSIPDNSLEEILNHEYSREWLLGENFNPNRKFTPRDIVKYGYCDRDMRSAFLKSGFELASEVHLKPKNVLERQKETRLSAQNQEWCWNKDSLSRGDCQ